MALLSLFWGMRTLIMQLVLATTCLREQFRPAPEETSVRYGEQKTIHQTNRRKEA